MDLGRFLWQENCLGTCWEGRQIELEIWFQSKLCWLLKCCHSAPNPTFYTLLVMLVLDLCITFSSFARWHLTRFCQWEVWEGDWKAREGRRDLHLSVCFELWSLSSQPEPFAPVIVVGSSLQLLLELPLLASVVSVAARFCFLMKHLRLSLCFLNLSSGIVVTISEYLKSSLFTLSTLQHLTNCL